MGLLNFAFNVNATINNFILKNVSVTHRKLNCCVYVAPENSVKQEAIDLPPLCNRQLPDGFLQFLRK